MKRTVAVVGAGPSGFYAVQALLQHAGPGNEIEVDLLDRLPTPFGLVRYGVAPDHQKIKQVTRAYDKIAAHAGFRYLGGVSVGAPRGDAAANVGIDELLEGYDQVILAVGCEDANALGIPGEGLPGSHSATEFVGWYNGHPDHVDRSFRLDHPGVVVVGVGNVAMDVTRVLLADRDHLHATDIASHALTALRGAAVTDVWLLGRRGPAQVAFTHAELDELSHLPDTQVLVRPEDLALDPLSAALEASPKDKNLHENLHRLHDLAAAPRRETRRRVHLWLNTSPISAHGHERLERVVVGRNRPESDDHGNVRAVDTGAREEIPAGLLLRAVGYRGRPIAGVPFDPRTGTIPNAEGRVADRLYVVGWAKRGPKGLIGTNRADSHHTVERVLEDAAKLPEVRRTRPASLAAATTWADWTTLDGLERARGQAAGKLREKLVRVGEMRDAIATARTGSGG